MESIFGAADRDRDRKLTRAEWDAFVSRVASQFQPHGLIAIKPGGEGNITANNVLWKGRRQGYTRGARKLKVHAASRSW